MERIDYLKTTWESYPALPAKTRAAGRLHSLTPNEKGGCQLEILRDGIHVRFELLQIPLYSDILIAGDIIALLEDNQILLLAPSNVLKKGPLFPKEKIKKWNAYLRDVRDFFTELEFVEVKTPSLVPCPGTEPSLDVFSTELKVGSRKEKLFLPTSPELHLKKTLAMGAEKVFEIASCFRNGEITERHQPEFWMLEWYRAYANLDDIKKDVVNLVTYLTEKLQVPGPQKIYSKSIPALFQEYCDFDLKPTTNQEELKELALKLRVDVRSAETIDDYFFLIFLEKIENQLPPKDLIFVENYPPYQAALARLTPEGWGDRFEVYWQGFELANAFHELNDPKIQKLRSQEDVDKKSSMHKEPIRLDDEFFAALERGLPPSGGIALGVERLYMALTGVQNIADLRVFPFQ